MSKLCLSPVKKTKAFGASNPSLLQSFVENLEFRIHFSISLMKTNKAIQAMLAVALSHRWGGEPRNPGLRGPRVKTLLPSMYQAWLPSRSFMNVRQRSTKFAQISMYIYMYIHENVYYMDTIYINTFKLGSPPQPSNSHHQDHYIFSTGSL